MTSTIIATRKYNKESYNFILNLPSFKGESGVCGIEIKPYITVEAPENALGYTDTFLYNDENIETYEDTEINKEKLSLIFAWLPSIETIEVDRSWGNTWLNIVFVNGERINSIYNTGLEYALCCLVEREG